MSGNYGHAGRPGQRGGSAPGKAAQSEADRKEMIRDAYKDLRAQGIKKPSVRDVIQHIKDNHGETVTQSHVQQTSQTGKDVKSALRERVEQHIRNNDAKGKQLGQKALKASDEAHDFTSHEKAADAHRDAEAHDEEKGVENSPHAKMAMHHTKKLRAFFFP